MENYIRRCEQKKQRKLQSQQKSAMTKTSMSLMAAGGVVASLAFALFKTTKK